MNFNKNLKQGIIAKDTSLCIKDLQLTEKLPRPFFIVRSPFS